MKKFIISKDQATKIKGGRGNGKASFPPALPAEAGDVTLPTLDLPEIPELPGTAKGSRPF